MCQRLPTHKDRLRARLLVGFGVVALLASLALLGATILTGVLARTHIKCSSICGTDINGCPRTHGNPARPSPSHAVGIIGALDQDRKRRGERIG